MLVEYALCGKRQHLLVWRGKRMGKRAWMAFDGERGMSTRWNRLYEPPPPLVTPWLRRPLRIAGGLTPVGLAVAFLLAMPVVAGAVLLAWPAAALLR